MNHLTRRRTDPALLRRRRSDAPAVRAAPGRVQPSAAAHYGALQRVLNVVDTLPVPERGGEYGGARSGGASKRRLPAPRRAGLWRVGSPGAGRRRRRPWPGCWLLAFLAGRFSQPAMRAGRPALTAADPQAGERVLLVAVGDYLERSQMVLIELANANPKGPLDISAEQERAADLVGESRLYRQTAAAHRRRRMAGVLDDLDRVLVEIAHAPSRLSAAGIAGFAPEAGSRRHSVQDPGAGLECPQPETGKLMKRFRMFDSDCACWRVVPPRRRRSLRRAAPAPRRSRAGVAARPGAVAR